MSYSLSPFMNASQGGKNFGPRSWNHTQYASEPHVAQNRWMDTIGGMMKGSFGQSGQQSGNPGGLTGPGMQVDTGIQPSGVYDPNSLQVMRNQIRANVPTAPGSMARHTPAGVSSSIGTESDLMGQQLGARMEGEDAVQNAMLQARLANAQQLLGGQQAAVQSGMGLASGALDRLGIGQNMNYALRQQGIAGGNSKFNLLMGLLNYV